MLKDPDYIKLVKNKINNKKKDYTVGMGSQTETTSTQMLFEVLKLRIRGVTIPYSSRWKKLKKQERKLKPPFQSLENLMTNTTEDRISKIRELKEELKVLR